LETHGWDIACGLLAANAEWNQITAHKTRCNVAYQVAGTAEILVDGVG